MLRYQIHAAGSTQWVVYNYGTSIVVCMIWRKHTCNNETDFYGKKAW